MKTRCTFFAFLVLAISFLSACGGGGGGGGGDGGNPCSVSASSLSFSADEEGVTPAGKTVRVTVNRGTTAIMPSAPDFLDASFHTTGQASGDLVVTPRNPTVLGPGVYEGTVRVGGCYRTSGEPHEIAVSYTVNGLPRVVASVDSLDFVGVDGGGAIPARSVDLSYEAGSTDWTTTVEYVHGGGWLTVVPGDGAVLPTTLGVSVGELPPGLYQASIRVQYQTEGYVRVLSIPVTYEQQPALSAPSGFSVELNSDSTADDLSLDFGIVSNSGAAVDWTAVADVPWLSVSPAEGTANPSGEITLNLVPSALGALASGEHVGWITLSSSGADDMRLDFRLIVDLPRAQFVAPYVIETGEVASVIMRGDGFDSLTTEDVSVGGQPVTEVQVVSETEARVILPALATGAHDVELASSLGIDQSDVRLVSAAPLNAQEEFIPLSGNKRRLIYDAERRAVYAANTVDDRIDRFSFNGTAWQADSLAIAGLRDLALMPNGAVLLALTTASVVYVDTTTFAVQEAVPYSPSSVDDHLDGIAVANNGLASIVRVNQSRGGAWQTRRFDAVDKRFLGLSVIGHHLPVSPADGSHILLPWTTTGTFGEVTSGALNYYDASTGTFSGLDRSLPAPYASIDRNATAVLVGLSVYDGSLGLLGTLSETPALTAAVLSPDGQRVYALGADDTFHMFDLTAITNSDPLPASTTTALTNLPGGDPTVITSFDGGTLFIGGNAGLVVRPAQ